MAQQLRTIAAGTKRMVGKFEKNLPKDANADDRSFITDVRKRIDRNDPVMSGIVNTIIESSEKEEKVKQTFDMPNNNHLYFGVIVGIVLGIGGIDIATQPVKFILCDLAIILGFLLLRNK